MKRSPVTQRLLALFVAGWALFGFPLLQLWAARPLVVFGLWLAVIGAVAWVMERGSEP